MSRHSLARKADIKAGKSVWVLDHCGNPKKVIIRARVPKDWNDTFYSIFKTKSYRPEFSMADRGVTGYEYDARPVQVFLNERSAKYWANKWRGINPNFIDRHTGKSYAPYFDEYDF